MSSRLVGGVAGRPGTEVGPGGGREREWRQIDERLAGGNLGPPRPPGDPAFC